MLSCLAYPPPNFNKLSVSYSDTALREPVIITSHNRDRLVLMSVDEYQRLKLLETSADQLIEERIGVHRNTLEKLADK